MAAPVFFSDDIPAVGAVFMLDGDEGRHASTVRRIGVGNHIVVSDGAGVFAQCEVIAAEKRALRLLCLATQNVTPAEPKVIVVQALPKSERSELAVDLATEAGADDIYPWAARRCIAKWSGDKVVKGVAKWQTAAREAAKQARRAYVPTVHRVLTTTELAGLVHRCVSDRGVALVLHEEASEPLPAVSLVGVTAVIVIVGPEGGVSPDELTTLREAGARPVLLGPNVLRTSTAAAVALGAISALTGRWNSRPVENYAPGNHNEVENC